MKFDIKQMGIVLILSVVSMTIISMVLSNYTDIQVVKTGPAFIVILVSIFLVYLMIVSQEGKFERKEIITMLILAGVLIGIAYAIKTYVPSIFSILPVETQNIFSAVTG